MRPDLPPPPGDRSFVSRSGVTVTLYRSATPRDLIVGTPGTGVDLTPFVERVSHKAAQASITLTHAGEFAGANRPARGQAIEIRIGSAVAWRGVVGTYAEEEDRGMRRGTLTVRRRDALPAWRNARRVSPVFSIGTDLGEIARAFAESLGLTPLEYLIPAVGVALAHDSMQIADVTGWEMLRTALGPGLREPFVDGRGILRTISRDVRRAPVLDVPLANVVRRGRSVASEAPTTVRVKWLDPQLSRVDQQEKIIAEATLAAGFFKPWDRKYVWWSQDHSQRADATRMVVRSSINDGLLHVGSESYTPTSIFGGHVTVSIDYFLPTLATAMLAGLLLANWIPEPVQVGATGTGFTLPGPRPVVKGIAETGMWMAVLTMGQGVYEVWGTPYDFVHVVNEVEAYDENADPHVESVEEIETNLIPSEAVAEAVAVGELLYRAKAANRDAVVIADDLRIEPGDILRIAGSPYYVTDYSRDLSRGASAELALEGFYV